MNTTLKNAFSLLFSQVGTILMSSILLVFVPTYFGEEDFGKYTYAAVLIAFFGLVGAAGTGTFLVKTIARDRTQLASYAANAVTLKLTMGTLLSVGAALLGVVLDLDRTTLLFGAAALIVMNLTMVNEILVSCLHGIERMGRPATVGAVAQVLAGIATLILISAKLAPTSIALLAVPFSAIPIVVNAAAIRAETAPFRHIRIKWSVWKVLLIGGLPFMLYQIVLYAYGSVDLLMLRPMTDSQTVGWYALAYRIISLPVLLAATALLAMFPSLSVQAQDDPGRLANQVNRALRFISFVTFPLAVGTIAVAPALIDTFYTADFEQSAVLIRILALSMPIVVVDVILGMALFATDRQSSFLVIGVIAAIINPALNYVAIPYTVERFSNGAIGAASITVLTELVIMFGAMRIRPTGVLDSGTAGFLFRCGACAAAIAPAAIVVGAWGLPAMVLSGAVAYFFTTRILDVIPRQELSHLYSQVRRKTSRTTDEIRDDSPIQPTDDASSGVGRSGPPGVPPSESETST
ncbi:MAG: flippase [Ilumatobacter sp.]|uniref:flippase n=1 Tax=Bacteria TaxID=2 RepID=UPI003296D42B